MFSCMLLGLLCLLVSLQHVIARPLNSAPLDVYDYIVVGGGVSGLVVANRLTEDPNITVLVLEAGQADNYEEDIMVPIFVGADVYSTYDWYFQTLPQTYLDGAMRRIPQGRALGGGSILNAMLWNRGGRGDYQDWEALGNPGWGWDSLLPYFMKSETFTPINDPQLEAMYGIDSFANVHGSTGPVNVSYQGYFYNTSANFFQGLNHLGMPTVLDPNEGSAAGATFLPLDISPSNKSRADARRSYWDPYVQRDNFHVLTGQYVTQIIFADSGVCANNQSSQPAGGDSSTGQGTGQGQPPVNGQNPSIPDSGLSGPPPSLARRLQHNKRQAQTNTSPTVHAVGVQYASNSGASRQTVRARREVILAAGSLQSPKILELSGIGSRTVLDQHNITTLVQLPGVGENLQDHQLVGTYYQFYNSSYTYSNQLAINATLNQLAMQEYYANRTGPWTAGPANGNAFPSLPQISNRTVELVARARAQSPYQYLRQGLDSTVVAGFEAQLPLIIDALGDPNRAVIELLNSNAGNLSPSNMRPFSRGTSHINSSDPFVPPAIDPRYGSNPIDVDVLYEALLFNRLLLATPSMALLEPVQWAPPSTANETALRQFIANSIGTEYHPSGTCAMLPLNYGGVVDPNLLVYGTDNIRVVDASIHPIVPAAHLQAVVYGVAEKAADIIKAANRAPAPADPQINVSLSSCANASSGSNATLSHQIQVQSSTNTSMTVPTASIPGTTTITVTPSSAVPMASMQTSPSGTTTVTVTPSMISASDVISSMNMVTGPTVPAHRTTASIQLSVPAELIQSTSALMPPAPGPFAGYTPLSPTPVMPLESMQSLAQRRPVSPSAEPTGRDEANTTTGQELPAEFQELLSRLIIWIRGVFGAHVA